MVDVSQYFYSSSDILFVFMLLDRMAWLLLDSLMRQDNKTIYVCNSCSIDTNVQFWSLQLNTKFFTMYHTIYLYKIGLFSFTSLNINLIALCLQCIPPQLKISKSVHCSLPMKELPNKKPQSINEIQCVSSLSGSTTSAFKQIIPFSYCFDLIRQIQRARKRSY